MSHSRLLVVLGTGNRYTGEGLQPDALMSFYDDKTAWVLQTGAGGHRLFTEPEFCVDDALAMVAGLYLARAGAGTLGDSCGAIRGMLPHCYALEESAKDWHGRCLTLARQALDRSEWERLYAATGKALAEINLKTVWVFLAQPHTTAGRRRVPGVETVQARLQARGLKNYGICTPCAGNSYGDFDAP